MEKGDYKFFKDLTLLVLAMAMTLPGLLVRAFVFMKLWAWFVVVQFDLAALTLETAIGIGLIVSFLTLRSTPYVKEEAKAIFTRALAHSFVSPAVVLLIGWVVHVLR